MVGQPEQGLQPCKPNLAVAIEERGEPGRQAGTGGRQPRLATRTQPRTAEVRLNGLGVLVDHGGGEGPGEAVVAGNQVGHQVWIGCSGQQLPGLSQGEAQQFVTSSGGVPGQLARRPNSVCLP